MGKVKLRIVGDESAEQEQKNEQKKKNEAKKSREAGSRSARQAKGLNMGGGQRINSVGPTEEELMAETKDEAETKNENESKSSEAGSRSARKARGKKAMAKEARTSSKRYNYNLALAKGQSASGGKSTVYPVAGGVEILKKFKASKFDETVELHINVLEKGISGQVSLPHGTGKTLRIKIADDALLAEVEKGNIDFDVLIAAPSMMPKLGKVAKILGPRGLMPNPKAGTITDKPDALIEKLSKGQINYKTEAAAPLIHLSVGKISFDEKKLQENISTVIRSIGAEKITEITLKSTMSPAIRIQI